MTTAFIAIRDRAKPTDGDYLTQTRDPSCPQATATPTMTPYVAPTLTLTPGDGRTLLDDLPFGALGYDVASVFKPYTPANVGMLGYHVGTIDLMPKELEKCIDKYLFDVAILPSE